MNIISDTTTGLLHSILTQDNHPPLYYLLLRQWTAITAAGIPMMRVLSFIFGGITLAFLAIFYRNYKPRELTFILGLIATNPLFIYYSATVRPYALVVLLATVLTVCALRLRQIDAKAANSMTESHLYWKATYYISGFLLGLTHYFGTLYVWLIVILNYCTPGRPIHKKPWGGLALLGLTSVWPILQIFLGTLDQQKEANSWVRVYPLISTVNNFLAGNFPLLMISRSIPQLLFGVVLALVLILIVIRRQISDSLLLSTSKKGASVAFLSLDPVFLSLISLAVLGFGCIADLVLPFTTPYYFLVCLPAVAILFAKALESCYQDQFKKAICLFLFVAITALQLILSQQRLALA